MASNNWTSGYVADIGYTFGYYHELNPLRVSLGLLNAGIAPPTITHACELGFGQGMSANIHAASSSVEWHGTDFNPSQAGFAQALANASGAKALLHDQAFSEFCRRDDLPDFDYIGLHGIWSWISDENRSIIVDFIRRKLRVGGVVFISYNTQPGWAAFAPMRHLMTEHAEIIGSDNNGILNNVGGALDFAEALLAVDPAYATANPQVRERLKNLKTQNRQYLAHEYFNRDWMPMHFGTVAKWLSDAKLSFACSEHPIDFIDAANLNEKQQTFLNSITDPLFKQTVRDYIVNQQFRRDYWIKGPRALNALERQEALARLRFVLTKRREDVSFKFNGALGECTMDERIYGAILDVCADYQPKTLLEISERVRSLGINFYDTHQALCVLVGTLNISLANSDESIQACKPVTDRLNTYLREKSRGNRDLNYLASPVTGGAEVIPCFEQLFLTAIVQGKKKPQEWADYVWSQLQLQGQKIVIEGKTLETDEENLAELVKQATNFSVKRLAVLKSLQVI